MCGIVGAMAFGPKLSKAEELIRQDSMMYIVTELLQLTKERGEDATGVSTLFRNGVYHGLKMGVDSDKFTTMYGGGENDYDGYLKQWEASPHPASMFIGHCRKSSVGNSWDNVNNHPIRVRDTIGIHNGTLKNHNQIFKQLNSGRDGSVDSEAIIRLLNHYSNNGKEPWTNKMIEEVARRLEGTFSVLAFNGNNPFQMVTMRDGRPMEYALVRPLKTVFVASEQKFFKRVFLAYNNMARLYNHRNFKPLVASDVVFDTLRQNGQAIFDLTRDVDDKTNVGDLCEEDTVPFQRIWKVGSKPTPPKIISAHGVNVKTVDGNKAVAKKKLGKELKGLIWVKSLSQFKDVSAANVEEDKKTGQLEVSAKYSDSAGNETGKEKPATNAEASSVKEANNVETLIAAHAAVTEKTAEIKLEKQEVDMTVDPQAMEEAEKAAKELPTLENDEDVQEVLEIADLKTLQALPLPALCNRVRRSTFKGGFYKGMLKAYETVDRETAPTSKEDHTEGTTAEKLVKAQNQIRLTKVIVSMFSDMVHTLKMPGGTGTSYSRTANAASIAVKALNKDHGVDEDTFDSLFSVGDRRDDNIRALKNAIGYNKE